MAEKGQFVVDSSVVTKWFLSEPGSDLAISLRDKFATGALGLAVPTLLFYEVINTLRYSGAFNAQDLTQAATSLSRYRFEVWRPRGKLLELSAEMSLREEITAYDACYVALAERTGTKLITEDKDLIEKFPAHTLRLGVIGGVATVRSR